MPDLLALLAACAFALVNVLQQKGTLEVPADEGVPHFLAQILRRPSGSPATPPSYHAHRFQ